jgi:hypothetical protein
MNEERLRGELMEMGPAAQAGFVGAILGDKLYDQSARGQYISRRLMKRYLGGTSQQADMNVKMAQESRNIILDKERMTAAHADQTQRDTEEIANRTWEGAKRQLGKWWDQTVNEPLQKLGADVSRGISEAVDRWSNQVFGRAAGRNKVRGMSRGALQGLQKGALGDTEALALQFGEQGRSGGGGGEGEFAFSLTGAARTVAGLAGVEQDIALPSYVANAFAAAAGGKFTDQGAMALGIKDAAEGERLRGSLGGEMEKLLGGKFARNLRVQTGGGPEYNLALARAVQEGRVGGAGLRKLVQGTESGPAAMRLASMQPAASREGATAMDAGGMLGGMGGEITGRAILTVGAAEKAMGRAEEGMAAALTGVKSARGIDIGPGDLFGAVSGLLNDPQPVSVEDVGRLRTLVGRSGSFEDAAKMSARAGVLSAKADKLAADGNVEAAAQERKRAASYDSESRRIVKDIQNSDIPTEARDHLNRLLNMTPKERRVAMGKIGTALAGMDSASYKDTIQRRMDHVRKKLGFEAIEKLEKVGGASLAALLGGEATDPATRMEKLKDLISQSAEDKGRSQKLLGMLKGVDLVDDVRQAITGGMGMLDTAEALTKRTSGQVKAGKQLFQDLGADTSTFDKNTLKGIRQGDQGVIGGLLTGLSGEVKKNAEAAIQAIRQGNMPELIRLQGAGALVRTQKALGRGVQDDIGIAATAEGKDRLKMLGAKGSPEGIHSELTRQTVLLYGIKDAVEFVAKKGKSFAVSPEQKRPK